MEGVRVSTLTIVEVDSEDQVTAPSNDFYKGPTELVQPSAYRGSSHQRKVAAIHLIDMVWLFRSPISVGGGGLFHLFT